MLQFRLLFIITAALSMQQRLCGSSIACRYTGYWRSTLEVPAKLKTRVVVTYGASYELTIKCTSKVKRHSKITHLIEAWEILSITLKLAIHFHSLMLLLRHTSNSSISQGGRLDTSFYCYKDSIYRMQY